MSSSDDGDGLEDMDSGNQDIEGSELDQHPGMPPRGSDKEHPQRAR
jgi:hypothetical protein